MTKGPTSLFFLGSAICSELFKRIPCREDAPSKANTDQQSHKEPSATN